jgi:uncharacterized protein (TIGR02217 family)
MAFFECEFTRKIQFQRVGGQTYNTSVIGVASGHEQRDRNWSDARAEYTASVITPQQAAGNLQQFIDDLRRFFLLVGGRSDGFRFFDPVDGSGTNEPLTLISGNTWQIQKSYSLGGRIYVRPVTKLITSAVLDFQGNALPNSVSIAVSGTSVSSIDYTTGLVTFAGSPTGTPTASFDHHIPVRFNTDKFEIETEESPGGKLIRWNSLGLIEVRPPNY